MAIKKIITCDICGRECVRWFDVHAYPSALYDHVNIADMIPPGVGVFSYELQMCKECFGKKFNIDGEN